MNKMDKDQLYIVFGFEHYNPLGIVRSLGENGIYPVTIVVKNRRPITSKSKYIKELCLVNDLEEGFQLLLSKYGNEKNKPYVLASDDQVASLFDKKYSELKDKFIFYNAGVDGRISFFMNKNNINQLAEKHGLSVLPNVTVDRGVIPENIEYPVITKAIISTTDNWKDDVFICENRDDLVNAYKHIKSEKVLIQKYIKKKDEYCLEGLSVDKGKKVFITIASNYPYLLEDSYSPYMEVRNFDRQDLKKKLDAMFEEIGFEGIYEIEFLVDKDDNLHFLEINFRNSTWSYASTCAGMPLPVLWTRAMKDSSILDNAYRKIPEGFTAMVEVADFKDRVLTHRTSLFKWIKELFSCNCTYYFSSRDIKPFISIFTTKLFKKN